jgi:hypothetical protein
MGRITQPSFGINFNHIVRDNENLQIRYTGYIYIPGTNECISQFDIIWHLTKIQNIILEYEICLMSWRRRIAVSNYATFTDLLTSEPC